MHKSIEALKFLLNPHTHTQRYVDITFTQNISVICDTKDLISITTQLTFLLAVCTTPNSNCVKNTALNFML